MADGSPTNFQKRTLWNAATGLGILFLGFLLVGLVWLSGTIFGYLQPVLVPLAVSGIIAYLLDPVVAWLQGRGLSRLRSVIVVFCGFVIALCIAALLVVPPITREVSELIRDREQIGERMATKFEDAKEWPVFALAAQWGAAKVDEEGNKLIPPSPFYNEEGKLVDDAGKEVTNPDREARNAAVAYRDAATQFEFTINKHLDQIFKATSNILQGGTSRILGILGYMIGFAMVPIYLYYFLKESSSIKAHWHDYVPLRASAFKDEVVDCLSEINGYILAFFRGQVLVAFIDGFLIGLALMIFQVPYALVIGLAMAILGVIPFVGNILCLVPSCIIAYVHFSGADPNHQWLGSNPWAYVGVVIAIFLIAQQINSLVTAPKIVGDSVGLHPMTVIFSMLFWSIPLGGFLGALLAVPLTASVKVLVRRYIWERKIMEESDEEPEPEPA